MLVLIRTLGENLMVGDEVTVTVLDVKGDQVRLGIDAPQDTPIFQEEILRNMNTGPGGRFRRPKRSGLNTACRSNQPGVT
tara:strand:+ start:13303 stop:13542 length:240 start_codon:yes stop_codon:yes gene_type:complete